MISEKNILVVEDEKPLSDAISIKLKKEGFSVLSARSVEQALGYLKDNIKVDVIWLDHYLLGTETGLDFVAKVKENNDYKNIPIFVVTNSGSEDKKQVYLQLGVSDYFIKSDYRLDEIIGRIRDHLER